MGVPDLAHCLLRLLPVERFAAACRNAGPAGQDTSPSRSRRRETATNSRAVSGFAISGFPFGSAARLWASPTCRRLDGSAVRHPGRKRSARLVCRARTRDRVEFAGAARFLRRIVPHVQTSSLADLQEEDLGKVQQALRVFENVQTRLRNELHRVLPALHKTSPVLQPQSRPERIVRAVLDRIQQDYAQPLTLRKCAGDLRVNAAYLSDLFPRQSSLHRIYS